MMIYPDVLSYLTKEHATVGPVQVALTTRPTTVRAGQEFEVILLIQSMEDVPVEVTVTLQLPAKDRKGKKDHFLSRRHKLLIALSAAEVGYVTLPVATLPDTTPGKYMIGMEVHAHDTEPGKKIRQTHIDFSLDTLTEPNQILVQQLKGLTFSAKKAGLMRSHVYEVGIELESGVIAAPPELKTGWTSLWTLADQNDMGLLIDKYGDIFRQTVLPNLKPDKLFEPLARKTFEVFKNAGYALKKEEVFTGTRMLLAVIDAAHGHSGSVNVGVLDVLGTIKSRQRMQKLVDSGRELTIEDLKTSTDPLPRWAKHYFRLIVDDIRYTRATVRVISEIVYEDLLYDALLYGFRLVEQEGGEHLGEPEEMAAFAEDIMKRLKVRGQMNFSYAYLPFLMGGLIVTEKILRKEERITDVLEEIRFMVEDRGEEINEDAEPVYEMAKRIMDITLRKYGLLGSKY